MKTTLLLSLLSAFVLAGCSKTSEPSEQNVIRIEPLTKAEIRAIQTSLRTGRPLEQIRFDSRDGEEVCEPPVFWGLNTQGYVTVPEDYSQPQGRQIKVFYYGRVQKNWEPVVFFNGGPASDSHGSANVIENSFIQTPVHKLSFVYIDQRGTGCSDAFPSEPTPETVERLTHYTSENIVRDSEAVREKLFGAGSKWKIFGQSYGGLIVHRYSMVAPGSVQAAYAHGFSLMNDQTEWLTLRIKSQKRVLELYFQKYPGDRAKLEKLRNLVAEDLCFEDQGTRVCGNKVLDAFTMMLGFSTSWSYMNQTIGSMLSADGSLNASVLEQFVRNYVFGVYNSSGLAGSVISIAEISNGGSDQEVCKIVNDKISAEGGQPDQWLINECRLLAGMQNNKWAELLKDLKVNFTMSPEKFREALLQNQKLPFYLYSGEKDVFVPVETFKEEVDLLGNRITYYQFPSSGHEGFYTEKQVWTDLLRVH